MRTNPNPFLWRDQSSTTGAALGRKSNAPKKPPVPITFSTRVLSSSIASAEKIKQRPGVGKSATA